MAPYVFAIVLNYAMRRAIDWREEELGFKIDQRRSHHHHPVVITDTDFADNTITTEEIYQGLEMLALVKLEAAKIGLHLNSKKTEVMHFNQGEVTTIKAKNGEEIESVNNFKYLGGWLENFAQDFEVQKALACSACHGLRRIWKSNLRRSIRKRVFKDSGESILLYGSKKRKATKAPCGKSLTGKESYSQGKSSLPIKIRLMNLLFKS